MASDIHFYPFLKQTDIYLRIHGKRKLLQTIPTAKYNTLLAHYKFMSGMDIGENRRPQNGTVDYKKEKKQYSLRLSTLPIHDHESLAIRLLPQEEHLTLEELFLFQTQVKRLKQWMTKGAGLILLTGPTGSGKTTTLYALLETILKERSLQAITLEDPIEKDLTDILQVQVNEQAGITYQAGLKAALRHDPDILMVGEIRDKHIAHFAHEASLTGHLVLSTLHAKDAVGTIHRLLEMGLTRVELQQTLMAVVALELIPITMYQKQLRRAAIAEFLDGRQLEQIIQTDQHHACNIQQTFYHLRKKAYAYGYISKETFLEAKKR